MKKMWSGIKSIISHKSFTSSSINKIKGNDGNVTSDLSDRSNILNNFYINVAQGRIETFSTFSGENVRLSEMEFTNHSFSFPFHSFREGCPST